MKIDIMKNGPAIISAENEIELISGDEMRLSKKLALCRCGRSSNQILCDGSHQNYTWEK